MTTLPLDYEVLLASSAAMPLSARVIKSRIEKMNVNGADNGIDYGPVIDNLVDKGYLWAYKHHSGVSGKRYMLSTAGIEKRGRIFDDFIDVLIVIEQQLLKK